jgi:hypothetical protein
VAELIAYGGARAARRNGCGIWRHRPVGFSAPEEAGWITGYAINANGGHVHH